MRRHGRVRRLKAHKYKEYGLTDTGVNSVPYWPDESRPPNRLSVQDFSGAGFRTPNEYTLQYYLGTYPSNSQHGLTATLTSAIFDVPRLSWWLGGDNRSGLVSIRVNNIIAGGDAQFATGFIACGSAPTISGVTAFDKPSSFTARTGSGIRGCVLVGDFASSMPNALFPLGGLEPSYGFSRSSFTTLVSEGYLVPIGSGEAGIQATDKSSHVLVRAEYKNGKLSGASLYVAIKEFVVSPNDGPDDIALHTTPTPPIATQVIELGRIAGGQASQLRRVITIASQAIPSFYGGYYGTRYGAFRACAAAGVFSFAHTHSAFVWTPRANSSAKDNQERHGWVSLVRPILCSCAAGEMLEDMTVAGTAGSFSTNYPNVGSIFDGVNRGAGAEPLLMPIVEDFGRISDEPYSIGATGFPSHTIRLFALAAGMGQKWLIDMPGRPAWSDSWMPSTIRDTHRISPWRKVWNPQADFSTPEVWQPDAKKEEPETSSTKDTPTFTYSPSQFRLVNADGSPAVETSGTNAGKPIVHDAIIRHPNGLADVRLGAPRFASRTTDYTGISDYDDEIPVECDGGGFMFAGKKIKGVTLKFEPYLTSPIEYAYSTELDGPRTPGDPFYGDIYTVGAQRTREIGSVTNPDSGFTRKLYEGWDTAVLAQSVVLKNKTFPRGPVSEEDQKDILKHLGFLWHHPIPVFWRPSVIGTIPACPLTGEFDLEPFQIAGIDSSPLFVRYSGESDFSLNKTWTHTIDCTKFTEEFESWNGLFSAKVLVRESLWQSTSEFTLDCKDANVEVYGHFLFGAQAAGAATEGARTVDIYGQSFTTSTVYTPQNPDGRATQGSYLYTAGEDPSHNRPKPIMGLALFARTSWIVSRSRHTTNSDNYSELDPKNPDGSPEGEFKDVPKLATRANTFWSGYGGPVQPNWAPANAAGGGMVPRWAIYTMPLDNVVFSAEQTKRLLDGEEVLATDWPLKIDGEEEEPIVLAADGEDISVYGHTVKATLIFAD